MKTWGIVTGASCFIAKFTGMLISICVVILASAMIVSAQGYKITDLGNLGSSQYIDMNNSGQVVGVVGDPWTGQSHAFLYSAGTMTDISNLGGLASFIPQFINDSGQIVGWGLIPLIGDSMTLRTYLYSGGTMIDLGTLEGYNSFEPLSINNSGQVVGQSVNVQTGQYGPFLYSAGAMTDLSGTLGGDATPLSINDSGQIAGQIKSRAFLYSGGTMTDLGSLRGDPAGYQDRAWAGDINNVGQVVGAAYYNDDEDEHAFLYSAGTMTDLGTLAGGQIDAYGINSEAYSINNSGQVVGLAGINSDGVQHAFLYSAGTMTDLTVSVFKDSPWFNIIPVKINDAGQIVGYGQKNGDLNGEWNAFLLTPDSNVNVNRPPVFTPVGQIQAIEGQLVQFTVEAIDSDGDSISYYTEPLPTGASFDHTTRTFLWTPDYDQAGTYTIRFFAEDDGTPTGIGDTYVTISVSVPPPGVLINQIIDSVYALAFSKHVENSYIANLKKVGTFINDGKLIPALNQLNAAIKKIATDMKKGIISDTNGNKLIMMITLLINELNS